MMDIQIRFYRASDNELQLSFYSSHVPEINSLISSPGGVFQVVRKRWEIGTKTGGGAYFPIVNLYIEKIE